MVTRTTFINRIHQQIEVEKAYAKSLEEGDKRLSKTKYWLPIPFIILIIWSVYVIGLGLSPATILVLWITASFFIYMFYFFLMALPSLGSGTVVRFTDKNIQENIREFLRLANLLQTVRSNKITLIEVFLNAFIINAKPLAKGFAVIYLVDLLLSVVLVLSGNLHYDVFLMIVFQIVIIMAFYAKLYTAEPNTPGFFSGVYLPEAGEVGSYFAKLKTLLYISVFGIFTGLIIIGAMFFPGLTLGEYLSDIQVMPFEYPMVMALCLLCQGVVLRYIQGVESRKYMGKLNAYHLSVLEDYLLLRVIKADDVSLDTLRREFLLISMNTFVVQEFFKRFPAYALVPNILLIGDATAQDVLDKTGDEKSIFDIL